MKRLLLFILLFGLKLTYAQVNPSGNALNFDGSNDYVNLATNPISNTTNFTYESWVNYQGTGGYALPRLFDFNNGAGNNVLLGILHDTRHLIFYIQQAGADENLQSNVSLALNTWYHVAVTVQNGTWTLYINGVADVSTSGHSLSPVSVGTTASNWLGKSAYTTSDPTISASMDEIRIWNYARTAAQITANYNLTVDPATAGLVTYYRFDQGTANGTNTGVTSLTDLSSGGNTGTLMNFNLTGTGSNWIGSGATIAPLLKVTTTDNSTATFVWPAPPEGQADSYLFDLAGDAAFTNIFYTDRPVPIAQLKVVNIQPNTTVYARVRAINGGIAGPNSNVAAAFTVPLNPPGNALDFDGVDDFVKSNATNFRPTSLDQADFTLETWIKTSVGLVNAGIYSYENGDNNWQSGEKSFYLAANGTPAMVGFAKNYIASSQPVNDGNWHHVAITYVNATQIGKIYIDGVDQTSGSNYGGFVPDTGNDFYFGRPNYSESNNFFKGSLDQFRVWNRARSLAEVRDGMLKETPTDVTGLRASYNFNHGTAGANNNAIVTLGDQTGNGFFATTQNFALNNATSNWVTSYAMGIPTSTAATNPLNSSFTANWTGSTFGTASSYQVDVATDAAFSNILPAYTAKTAAGTSLLVNNILPGTNYYYRVRAVYGGTDVSGNSLVISTATTSLAPPGNALSFNGSPYVDLGTGVNVGTTFTEEAWIYSTSSDSQYHGILGTDATIRGPFLYVYQNNQIHGGFGTAGGGLEYYITNTPGGVIKPNAWNHLAQTFDGTNLILYVNGVEAYRQNLAGKVPASPIVKTIGRMDNYFQGTIDEVRLWNVVRTPAQIQASYNQILPGTTPGLVAYYNFDHGTANGTNTGVTTLYDQTANVKNGTLTGFALTAGSASNWVGSYALVVPTAIAATLPDQTSFTAKWTAPAIGTVTSYTLEVAADPAFTTIIRTISGTTATSSTISGLVAGTAYYYRVRAANGAEIGGNSNVIAINTIIATPPGNALDLKSSGSNYATVNSTTFPSGTSSYTIEAWINPTNLTPGNATQAIIGWGTYTNNSTNVLRLGYQSGSYIIHNYWYANDFSAVIPNIGGKWSHITATYDQPTNTRSIYLNGQLIGSETVPNPTHIVTSTNITVGASFGGTGEYFNGKLDGIRVYNTALSQVNIQADMVNTAPAVPGSLVAYYDFDQGIGGGDNTGITSLRNTNAATNKGTLVNVTKTGTTSNFTGPNTYAVEVPVTVASSNITTNSFSANWSAIAAATTTYYLDVATDATFTNFVATYSNKDAGNVLTSSVTGLTAGSTYYYRVRANNEFDGRSLSSNVTSVTLLKIDQSITLAGTNTITYGTADYTLTANSTNTTLPLTYAITSGDAVTISAAGLVHVVKAGTVEITVNQAGNANYNAANPVTQTLTINPAILTVLATGINKIYDGNTMATVTLSDDRVTGDIFTASYTTATFADPNVNTGIPVSVSGITISGASAGNYTLGNPTAATAADITGASLTITATGPAKAFGQALTAGTSTANFNSTTAIGTEMVTSVTLTPDAAGASATTPAGSAYVVTPSAATGANGFLAGNYNITYTPFNGTVGVTAQTISFNPLANATYGAAPIALTASSTSGLMVSYSSSNPAVASVAGNTLTVHTAGTTTITATQAGDGNFTPATSVDQSFTVDPKAITVTADIQTKVYGTANPALTYTNTPLVGADAFSGALSRLAGENIGTYAIGQNTLALSSNYTLSYIGANLAITAKPVTVTATAGQTKVYGTADPVFAYTINTPLITGDAFTGVLARTAGENIGTAYAINQGSLALSSNYALSYIGGNFSITAKPITAIADAKTKEYGSADPALTFTTDVPLIGTDAFTGNISRTVGENAGTYAINKNTLALSSNYTLSYTTANLTISKKALTITADNKVKFQGTANPALTASYAGFIAGENNTNLTAQPALSTTATNASVAGSYPIIVNAATSNNYAITFVPGTLTVASGIPTSLSLAPATLYENRAAGTIAGSLSSTSQDPGATFTYTLVTGAGSTDNGAFSISGNQLLSAQSFDFETKNAYNIRVRTTTQYGLSLEQTFTVNISDVNEIPTLSAVADQAICYVTGTQNVAITGITAGPETAQSTTISVSSNNPNLFATLSVSKTGTAGTLSYSAKTGASGTATVTVTVQDNGGTANSGTDTFTRTFTITIFALPTPAITSNKGNSVGKGETIQLTATGGTSYVWAANSSILSGQNTAVLTVRPSVTTTYTVTATNANGCSESTSFTIAVESDYSKLVSTNILTPNNDGFNDKWVITNIDLYGNNEAKVFDKAGRLVYSKKNYDNSWDGTFNGAPLSEDTYYYIVDFGPGKGRLKGFITIIREQ